MPPERLIIQPFDPNTHDHQAFHCGKPALDDLLHDVKRLGEYGRTFVVVSQDAPHRVLAYFTLLPSPQDIIIEGNTSTGFTAILLNGLAVDLQHQNQGIGRWTLLQLILWIVEAAKTHQLDYLLVLPLDDEARNYYQHINMGFISSETGDSLFLSIETMRQAARDASHAN